MAIKTERVAVGGAQFEITQLGAESGRGLYKRFVTAIGPLLRELLSGSGTVIEELQKAATAANGDTSSLQAVGIQFLGPMILRAIEMLPDPLFEELCATFSQVCSVGTAKASNGQTVFLPLADQFGQHFAGNYVDMTAWLVHCLRVNGFLGLLGSGSAAQPVAQATA